MRERIFSNGVERISEYDLKDRYRDFLDDSYPVCRIGDASYTPSLILENVDQIAFRVGFIDWVDMEGWIEV